MSQAPGPGGTYDGDAMKAVARDTEALGDAFGKAKKSVEAVEATAACFGRLGEETMVGEVFGNTRDMFATSLGKAQQHVRELAEGVTSSFENMDAHDEAESRNLGSIQEKV